MTGLPKMRSKPEIRPPLRLRVGWCAGDRCVAIPHFGGTTDDYRRSAGSSRLAVHDAITCCDAWQAQGDKHNVPESFPRRANTAASSWPSQAWSQSGVLNLGASRSVAGLLPICIWQGHTSGWVPAVRRQLLDARVQMRLPRPLFLARSFLAGRSASDKHTPFRTHCA